MGLDVPGLFPFKAVSSLFYSLEDEVGLFVPGRANPVIGLPDLLIGLIILIKRYYYYLLINLK